MTSLAAFKIKAPLQGLSTEETVEFEMLDALAALDVNGRPTWVFEGPPLTPRENRWLELYERQVRATTCLRPTISRSRSSS
jgi:hypothetical protein